MNENVFDEVGRRVELFSTVKESTDPLWWLCNVATICYQIDEEQEGKYVHRWQLLAMATYCLGAMTAMDKQGLEQARCNYE